MYLFEVLTYHSTTIIKMSNNDYILPKAYASKPLILLVNHSLEKEGLHSMKMSNQTLQNLLCLWKKKTNVVFFVFSFRATLLFPLSISWSMLCRHRFVFIIMYLKKTTIIRTTLWHKHYLVFKGSFTYIENIYLIQNTFKKYKMLVKNIIFYYQVTMYYKCRFRQIITCFVHWYY